MRAKLIAYALYEHDLATAKKLLSDTYIRLMWRPQEASLPKSLATVLLCTTKITLGKSEVIPYSKCYLFFRCFRAA